MKSLVSTCLAYSQPKEHDESQEDSMYNSERILQQQRGRTK